MEAEANLNTAKRISKLFYPLASGRAFFIWITDGKGWLTTLKPLTYAFDKIDILLNLVYVQNGLMVDYISVYVETKR